MRAVIDIGSNSVLLLIAERDERGRVQVHEDHARITRLGRGAAKSGRLGAEAIERTLEVLAEYRGIASSHGAELCAVATEGLRLANDPSEFLRPAQKVLGQEVRLISGDEEAELSYLSVASECGDQRLRVVDIGGASTELVVGRGENIEQRRSHRIGSVRLTEAHVESDPPTTAALEAIATATRASLARQPLPPHPELHGLAGTVTTAAALMLELPHYDRERVDGTRWSQAEIAGLRDRLAALTLEERLRLPMLPAGRADVIVAGVTILLVAMEHCGARTLVVRDRGLRYALV